MCWLADSIFSICLAYLCRWGAERGRYSDPLNPTLSKIPNGEYKQTQGGRIFGSYVIWQPNEGTQHAI